MEGSVIVERQDANTQAYKSPVTVKMLLGGLVDAPEWAEPLIKTIEACTRMPGTRDWIHDEYNRTPDSDYAFAGPGSQPGPPSNTHSPTPSFLRKKKERQSFPPPHWDIDNDKGPYFSGNAAPSASPEFDGQNIDSFENSLSRRPTYNSSRSSPVIARRTGGTLIDDLDDPFGNAHAVTNAPIARGHVPRATSLGGDFGFSRSNRSLPASSSQYAFDATDTNDGPFSASPFPGTQRKSVQQSHAMPKPEVNRSSYPGEVRAIALFNFNAVEVSFPLDAGFVVYAKLLSGWRSFVQ